MTSRVRDLDGNFVEIDRHGESAGGGGAGAVTIIPQTVLLSDIAAYGGVFAGPPVPLPVGTVILGVGWSVTEAFDDSGLATGHDAQIAICDPDGPGSPYQIGPGTFDLRDAHEVDQPNDKNVLRYGSSMVSNWIYKANFNPDRPSPYDFPVFIIENPGEARLVVQPSTWNGDGTTGSIVILYYLATLS